MHLPSATNHVWCLKYRPTTLSEYAFSSPDQTNFVTEIVNSKNIPHLLLSGPPGTGKTTLASILALQCIAPDDYDSDVLVINASESNSVDDMRNEIKHFITSYPSGPYKLVILQEADYLSLNAQGVLRDFMETHEQYSRFIITCNRVDKIDPAIRSRCQRLVIDQPNVDQIAMMSVKILLKEGVSIPQPEIVMDIIRENYPDVRSIIQKLQQCSTTGTLVSLKNTTVNDDLKQSIVSHITKDDWIGMAKLLPQTVPDHLWSDVFDIVHQNINISRHFNSNTGKWGDAILTLAEYEYRSGLGAKPCINGAAFFVQMEKLK